MKWSESRFRNLLTRFHAGTASEEEIRELQEILNGGAASDDLKKIWEEARNEGLFFESGTSEQMLEGILEKPAAPVVPFPRKSRFRRASWWVAASILLLVSIPLLYQSLSEPTAHLPPQAAVFAPSVIMPGSNKAVLVLDDGSIVSLDSLQNGAFVNLGGMQVVKTEEGRVAYSVNPAGSGTAPVYNTLRTPLGGQYAIVLEDGSKVWMNAGSSLRYPTVFTGKERVVELTGEAYFEVPHNAEKPFFVKTNNMELKVLGTHFNIMSYSDEVALKTTLLEGSVLLRSAGDEVKILPGEQAQLKNGEGFKVVRGVNLEEVIAWKNGYFQFDHAGIQVLMRQIARWYDVEIVYEGTVPERQFGGKITRSSSIEDVLKVLELSNVAFRIEGRKIIVAKK